MKISLKISSKISLYLAYFIVFTSLFFTNFAASAQCDSEIYTKRAFQTLSTGFTFVKSYKVDGKNGIRKQIEYTTVFSKDTNYMIRMAGKDGGVQGMIITLYDSQRNELATSHVNNKFFPGWTYKCKATGIYYLSFTFKDSQSWCGGAVLGFRR
jgi:hypothetical protein